MNEWFDNINDWEFKQKRYSLDVERKVWGLCVSDFIWYSQGVWEKWYGMVFEREEGGGCRLTFHSEIFLLSPNGTSSPA